MVSKIYVQFSERKIFIHSDMDILALQRQYANVDLFEQSTLSNSAEDLFQFGRSPYQYDVFGQDENDIDDGKFIFNL